MLFDYVLGNGTVFSFWYDPWINGKALVEHFPQVSITDSDIPRKAKVCDVWRRGEWRLPDPMDVQTAQAWELVRQLQVTEHPDTIQWRQQASGKFSVATAWKAFRRERPVVRWAALLWGYQTIPRHSFVCWLAIHDKLMTKNRLARWGLTMDSFCVMCEQGMEETVDHLFFACEISTRIWNRVLSACRIRRARMPWHREISWFCRKAYGKSAISRVRRTSLLATVYHIWGARNRLIFQQEEINEDLVFAKIKNDVAFKHYLGQRENLTEWC